MRPDDLEREALGLRACNGGAGRMPKGKALGPPALNVVTQTGLPRMGASTVQVLVETPVDPKRVGQCRVVALKDE